MSPKLSLALIGLALIIPLLVGAWCVGRKYMIQRKKDLVTHIIIESLRGDGELIEPYLVNYVVQLKTGVDSREAKSLLDELENAGTIVSRDVRGDPLGPWKAYSLAETQTKQPVERITKA
ncbi:MAG: hypothetical protein AAB381_00380 [Patescibacteria group bacterium]